MVKKIHGRKKRYLLVGGERNRVKRMKTFSTEEAAKKYAESIKLKNFKVSRTNYGLGRKFKIFEE